MSRPDLHPRRLGVFVIRRLPVTLGFLTLMLAANALAGTLSGLIDPQVLAARGIGVQALRDGDALRFVTAIFLSHDLPMLLRQMVFAGAVIGAAEWLWGSWRAAALFFGIDFAATLSWLAAVALIPGLNSLAGATDVGMSMGGFGLIGVLCATRRRGGLWLGAILGLVAVKYALSPDPIADGGHVLALIIGSGIGVYGFRTPAATGDPNGPRRSGIARSMRSTPPS